jgi:HD-GYP domain-containing protein (c-di-GMP phosphodiesterase class II)
VFVCDAFDAMTTDRAYSKAISEPAALAELARCSGTQFSPQAAGTFTACQRGKSVLATPEDRQPVEAR